jgi:uncharacterized protein with PQ loop repeat
MNFVDVIGYLGSAVVLISFLMKDIRTLRIVNTIGCSLFVIYGVMLHYSWPIIITNVAIVGINLFFFLRNR